MNIMNKQNKNDIEEKKKESENKTKRVQCRETKKKEDDQTNIPDNQAIRLE